MISNKVTIIEWPYRQIPGKRWQTIQTASMNHMLKNFGSFNKWVGYFDADEYFQFNDMHADLVLKSHSKSLVNLLDEANINMANALQFTVWKVSCSLSTTDLAKGRCTLLMEKCKVFDNTKTPLQVYSQKMWVKLATVRLMQNIHALDNDNHTFERDISWKQLGRFRHYHYGKIGENLEGVVVDESVRRYVPSFREKVGLVSSVC